MMPFEEENIGTAIDATTKTSKELKKTAGQRQKPPNTP